MKKDTNLPRKGSDESYDTKQSGGPFLIANRKMRSPILEPLRFLVLAPSVGPRAPTWSSTRADKRLYRSVLQATQRFRGQVYVKDGAIQERQLDAERRYRMHRDEESWHMLLVTPKLQIAGCARYLVHPNTITFEELALKHSPLAHDETWGSKVRHAFETEIRIARSEGLPYVELGGWALGEKWRGSMAALKILLASYAWAKLMGGWRCACTATVRHGSASILRRIGGGSLSITARSYLLMKIRRTAAPWNFCGSTHATQIHASRRLLKKLKPNCPKRLLSPIAGLRAWRKQMPTKRCWWRKVAD